MEEHTDPVGKCCFPKVTELFLLRWDTQVKVQVQNQTHLYWPCSKDHLKCIQRTSVSYQYGTAIARTPTIGLFAYEMAENPDVAGGISSSLERT